LTTWRRDVSILYTVALVFPLIYVISPKTTWNVGTPRFIVVLTPVLALLVAQLATTYRRGLAILVVAGVVSVVTLQRMDNWFNDEPPQTTHAQGHGPRHIAQWVPRDLDALVSGLDMLRVRHLFADYWLAHRLNFDTKERIIAAESRFTGLREVGGDVVPLSDQEPRYPPYEREVERARHAFVFYEQTVGTVPIVRRLSAYGYRRHRIGAYVVYVR
jgi:hypothetical protein